MEPKSLSYLNRVIDWLYEKSIATSHGDNYGKTPEDLRLSKKALSAIEIGFKNGQTYIKTFWGRKLAFYLYIPENQVDNYLKAGKLFCSQNPFDNPFEEPMQEPTVQEKQINKNNKEGEKSPW